MSHKQETKTAIEANNKALSGLFAEYGEDARKQIYDYNTGGNKYVNNPQRIILHHTDGEGCNPIAISNYHKNNLKNGTQGANSSQVILSNGSGSDVRYHYIIQANGSVDVVRNEAEVGRATKYNNIDVIHIAFCGDFTKRQPTEDEYIVGGKLISEIRARYGNIPIDTHGHAEGEKSSCPGKLLDLDLLAAHTPTIGKAVATVPKIGKVCPAKKGYKCLGWFDEITAYYSPMKQQGRYYRQGYEADTIINGDLVNAMGRDYKADHKFTHGACGYSMLGKKLWIDGRSEEHGEFTCVDRGGLIDANDIDIRYGMGRLALNAIDGKDDASLQIHHPQSAFIYQKI